MDGTFEFIYVLVGRNEFLRSKANGWNKPLGVSFSAVSTLDVPFALVFVKPGVDNGAAVLDIFGKLIFLINVLEISAEFLPARISLFESKVFPDFFIKKLINRGI